MSNPIRTYKDRKPSLQTGWGILTPFPSTTPFSLVLGTGSPCADYLYAGTLGFSATGFFTLFVVTHVSIRTSDTSRQPRGYPSQAYRTLRYQLYSSYNSVNSVYGFSPVTSSAQIILSRSVSYYAFFKGWLLLSQPPDCFGQFTSFTT